VRVGVEQGEDRLATELAQDRPAVGDDRFMSGPSPVELDLALAGDTLTGAMTWRGLYTLDSGEPLPLECAFDR
jgi:hypothetical protein